MTESGHGPDSPAAHVVMTVGTSVAGEILAGRYRLEEHISNDSHGRQVWRGSTWCCAGRSRSSSAIRAGRPHPR